MIIFQIAQVSAFCKTSAAFLNPESGNRVSPRIYNRRLSRICVLLYTKAVRQYSAAHLKTRPSRDIYSLPPESAQGRSRSRFRQTKKPRPKTALRR